MTSVSRLIVQSEPAMLLTFQSRNFSMRQNDNELCSRQGLSFSTQIEGNTNKIKHVDGYYGSITVVNILTIFCATINY